MPSPSRFVLTFPHEGREGTFRFYEGPPTDPMMSAKGVIILNKTAQVFESENKSKDHCFVITSQGVRDKVRTQYRAARLPLAPAIAAWPAASMPYGPRRRRRR